MLRAILFYFDVRKTGNILPAWIPPSPHRTIIETKPITTTNQNDAETSRRRRCTACDFLPMHARQGTMNFVMKRLPRHINRARVFRPFLGRQRAPFYTSGRLTSGVRVGARRASAAEKADKPPRLQTRRVRRSRRGREPRRVPSPPSILLHRPTPPPLTWLLRHSSGRDISTVKPTRGAEGATCQSRRARQPANNGTAVPSLTTLTGNLTRPQRP